MHRDLKLANILVNFPTEDLFFQDSKDEVEKKEKKHAKLKSIELKDD